MFGLKSFAVFVLTLFAFSFFTTVSAQPIGLAMYAQGAGSDQDSDSNDALLVIPIEFLAGGILSDNDDQTTQGSSQPVFSTETEEATPASSDDVSDDINEVASEIDDLRRQMEWLMAEIAKDNERRDLVVQRIHDLDKDKNPEHFEAWIQELTEEADMILGWIIREQDQIEEVKWQIKDLWEKKWELEKALAQAQKNAPLSPDPNATSP